MTDIDTVGAGTPNGIELGDIQGFVLRPYGDLHHAEFLFLRIVDAAAARAWLGRAWRAVESARAIARRTERPHTALQLAFTGTGLQAIGLAQTELDTFPREFVEGMTDPERARILGDVAESAPAYWDLWQPGETVHVLLAAYAVDDVMRAAFVEVMERAVAANGFHLVSRIRGVPRVGDKEPFGFRDGISQPLVDGVDARPPEGSIERPIPIGEFVLGYENGYRKLPASPWVDARRDGAGALPSLPQGRRDLGKNGSYLVFRKLEQDVAAFRAFASRDTTTQAEADLRAAKIVGRWPSGAPLVLAPTRDDPTLGAGPRANEFLFHAADDVGLRCPIASHVRRANPRDGLFPGPDDSLLTSSRHRLIRRGRPYKDASGKEGILFLAMNANLRRQFEFIQQTWINNPKFSGLYDDRDPLAGPNDDGGAVTIPAVPARDVTPGLTRFVRVRGGEYFFVPGLRALRFLASLGTVLSSSVSSPIRQ